MTNLDDSSPSDCSSGRFPYQEIFTYLRKESTMNILRRKISKRSGKEFFVKYAQLDAQSCCTEAYDCGWSISRNVYIIYIAAK